MQLSATGFYRTPKIWYDRARARGRPFYYFAYGAAVSEVVVDTLTGEYRLLRADLLHDVGRSINPAIDLGQIEGGFVQGMGWLTTEELCWNERGELTTHAPSTYKIPTASDLPADFRVRIFERGVNREQVVARSKAVGEPPLMLAHLGVPCDQRCDRELGRRPDQPGARCPGDARARAARDRGPEAPRRGRPTRRVSSGGVITPGRAPPLA